MISDEHVMEAAGRSMECAVNSTHERLKRGLNALATIGSTAPFVGLLGTVIGIMNAFKGTTAQKVTAMASAAGGISEALITTGLGLLLAVPSVWAYNYFTTQLESFDLDMRGSVEAVSTYLSGVQAANRDR